MSTRALHTRSAFAWTRIFSAPFWGIFNMLPIILYKDLGATPLEMGVFFTLKPAVSLFSLYWGGLVHRRPDRIKLNIISSLVISHLPFFFTPFVEGVRFYIFSTSLYMALARGSVPAWMEVLKLNIDEESRGKVYGYGSLFGYLVSAAIPLAFGILCDEFPKSWRYIFPVTALISFISIYFQQKIEVEKIDINIIKEPTSIKETLLKPLCESYQLMQRSYDFYLYQIGFMIGGAGLIIMNSAIPQFFVDVLNLSYTSIACARSFCKDIGFAVATPFWVHRMSRNTIFSLSALVCIMAAFFSVFLSFAVIHPGFLFAAYFLYGVMQAGSELSWNLSGLLFSKEEDSCLYSTVNILSVGLRGVLIPGFAVFLTSVISSSYVLLIGALICALGYERMVFFGKKDWKIKPSYV